MSDASAAIADDKDLPPLQSLKPLLAQQSISLSGDQPSHELVIIIQQLVKRVNEQDAINRALVARIRLVEGPRP